MTRPTRHLGLVPSQRPERYQAHDLKRLDIAAGRVSRHVYGGIALGLILIGAFGFPYWIAGAPWWFALSFAVVAAGCAWAACVRVTR